MTQADIYPSIIWEREDTSEWLSESVERLRQSVSGTVELRKGLIIWIS
jgi:hypothetical protein